jgi:hypothetical protein
VDSFSVFFPSLCAVVVAGLQSEGAVDLAGTIGGHRVRRVTYDRSCNGGYIYLGADTALVRHTIGLSTYPESLADVVNVDVAHDGSAFGVEVFPIDPQLRAAIEVAVRS